MTNEKCVLAYSGGLDTSALVPYMKEKYGYDIIAALVDVGRMKDVEMLRQRALTAGAVEAVVLDAKRSGLVKYYSDHFGFIPLQKRKQAQTQRMVLLMSSIRDGLVLS